MAKPASSKPTAKSAAAKAPAAKKAAAKPATKAPAAKPAAKKTGGTNALQTPLKPSPQLAVIVGAGPIPRGEVVSKIWAYIKSKNLQNPANKREILADAALRPIFGVDKVTMFEMNKHLAKHLS